MSRGSNVYDLSEELTRVVSFDRRRSEKLRVIKGVERFQPKLELGPLLDAEVP
jgi:hypothetical protein